nr:MAG TPA: hypothetical protein [Caudoviricetes sp.]
MKVRTQKHILNYFIKYTFRIVSRRVHTANYFFKHQTFNLTRLE